MPPERPAQPPRPEDTWDAFIDALDRAGQREGGAHHVTVPEAVGLHELAGRAFGDLTIHDAKHLSHVASALGRRGDTILTLWKDTQARLRGPVKRARRDKRRRPLRP
jgi:hypothetical protein